MKTTNAPTQASRSTGARRRLDGSGTLVAGVLNEATPSTVFVDARNAALAASPQMPTPTSPGVHTTPFSRRVLRDPRDDGPPRAGRAREAVVVDRLQAVQVIRHQSEERRRLGPSWLVDATRRRGRIGHARSWTGER